MPKPLLETEAEDMRDGYVTKVVAAVSVAHSEKVMARGIYHRHFC